MGLFSRLQSGVRGLMLSLVRSDFSQSHLSSCIFGLILACCLILGQSGVAQAKVTPQCAKLLSLPTVDNSVTSKELTFMTYNFANAFFKEAAIQRGDYESLRQLNIKFKDTEDLLKQRQIIREVDPDIVVGTELHKVEDVRFLLEGDPELQNRYDVLLIEGNDRRGINIAFFVKKSLKFRYKLMSHRHMKWTDPVTNRTVPLFSRDLPVLLLFREGEEIPFLIVIGNHAKSKRDGDQDPESSRYRTAQYEASGQIIDSLNQKNLEQYGRTIPIVKAGDFNTDTVKSPEIEPIRTRLKSVFDSVVGRVFSYLERVTHFFFGPNGRQGAPLDGIFVSEGIEVLDAYVYQYKDAQGRRIPDPRTFKQRETQPGDHEPVVASLRVL